jgi:hypothetical protein
MFTGLNETASPGFDIEAVKLTVPVKPLVLLTDMVLLPEEPTITEKEFGLAVIVNPGCGGEFTATETLTVLTSEPLIPAIVTA